MNLAQSALSYVEEEEEEDTDDGSAPNSTSFLKEIRDTVNKRIKLIKLADRSDAGWSMVANYTADNLAEDSDVEAENKGRREEGHLGQETIQSKVEKEAKNRFVNKISL